MPRFRVTERQVVEYTWFREAATPEEAERTSEDGVPEDATSNLVRSEVFVAEDDG